MPFFGKLNPFSNFQPSPFTIGEITYKTSEHYIQAEKTRHYGDTLPELNILNSETALDANYSCRVQIIKQQLKAAYCSG